MNCFNCGSDNPPDKKFCGDCGVMLPNRCPHCGSEGPGGKKFCGDCGKALAPAFDKPVHATNSGHEPRDYTPKHLADKILQSRSALEGERKQVTVLFADVKGSMELAEQLDAEEWHGILERFFAILTEGVHRFEGTVNQYTGDGIMALFGAPIAHEDHAQRACYAALNMREALRGFADELRRSQGISLSTRIGLNSGEVVVGRIGDDLRMDYTAQGHTVGLAQRMEQLAAADCAYLSAHTARLVEGYFNLRNLGEFNLKGASEPLLVYELQGVGALRTRLDSSRARGFSKFVGRDREMASLEDALDAAIAGNGQVVGVVADAGTGKSRLCLEFVERCKARGIRVNAAHCPAHGKTVPYLPLLEMLRDIFGIEARDSDHDARRKIAGELMLLDETFQALLPILFEFMGVGDPARPSPPMSAEGRQQKLFAFVRHLVQARSQREVSVLYLDDTHWIDPGSDAFLAHSVEAAAQTRTLWLVNFRPEYHAAWMSKSFYQQLPLRPLGTEAIQALLSDLLGNDASVASLPARIHERTGGNPFFIEEIVQSLVEGARLVGTRGAYRLVTSADTLELPATVQSVLAARLDRLTEGDKRVLQTASVIGKEFSAALLARVVAAGADNSLNATDLDDALASLTRAEFIFEAAVYPEVEYSFKHPLTQEVAYRSQLNSRRAQVHVAIAQAIEREEADALDERAALLAWHWEQAGELTIAARWYVRAAGVAGINSPIEAARHWEKSWEILQTATADDEVAGLRLRAATQLLNFSWRLGMSDERVAEIFAAGKALAVERGDARAQVLLHYALGLVHSLTGDPERAIPIYQTGIAVADATGDPELQWSSRTSLNFTLWQLGDLAAAQTLNDGQIALGELNPTIGMATVGIGFADSLWHRGVIRADLGRLEAAMDDLRRSIECSHQFGNSEQTSWAEGFSAHVLTHAGDVQGALGMARRAIDSAEKVGSVLARTLAHGMHGMVCTLGEDWLSARTSLEFALDLADNHKAARFLDAYFVAALAEAHLGLGDAQTARDTSEQAINLAQRMRMPVAEIRAFLAKARILRQLDPTDQNQAITAILDQASTLVRSTGARSYEPQILVERALLAGLLQDTAGRTAFLQQGHDLFTEMGAVGHAERTAALIAEAS